MTLQPAALDRLEQLAREADELRWGVTDWWYPPSALLDVDARLIAALSPAVVSELVAAARLGAAWQDVDRLAEKARRWRDSGMMTSSEYGAVCAVLYVADVEAVTNEDREWALAEALRGRGTP